MKHGVFAFTVTCIIASVCASGRSRVRRKHVREGCRELPVGLVAPQ